MVMTIYDFIRQLLFNLFSVFSVSYILYNMFIKAEIMFVTEIVL